MGPFAFVVVAFAAYRVTRVVTKDSISDAARDRLYRWAWVEPDETEAYVRAVAAAGATVDLADESSLVPMPRQGGLRTYVSELFQCPWCLGVWVSYALVALWAWPVDGGHTSVLRVLVLGAAVAGVQGFIASRGDA